VLPVCSAHGLVTGRLHHGRLLLQAVRPRAAVSAIQQRVPLAVGPPLCPAQIVRTSRHACLDACRLLAEARVHRGTLAVCSCVNSAGPAFVSCPLPLLRLRLRAVPPPASASCLCACPALFTGYAPAAAACVSVPLYTTAIDQLLICSSTSSRTSSRTSSTSSTSSRSVLRRSTPLQRQGSARQKCSRCVTPRCIMKHCRGTDTQACCIPS
jgi:hypothetical protein